ncbi:hypothetical protein FSST1_011861 [Fusarium sambucinum]
MTGSVPPTGSWCSSLADYRTRDAKRMQANVRGKFRSRLTREGGGGGGGGGDRSDNSIDEEDSAPKNVTLPRPERIDTASIDNLTNEMKSVCGPVSTLHNCK